MTQAVLGIIGGSGIYDLPGLENAREELAHQNEFQYAIINKDFEAARHELADIIRKGYERVGLTYDDGLPRQVSELSHGYPHYTHLLGLWAGRRALEASRDVVIDTDLREAIPAALENATGGVQQEYASAVASSQPDALFEKVLLACAQANKDSLGKFSATDVRAPLRRIIGRDMLTGAYQSHLAKFCETERGPILKKSGKRRSYKWRFVNPQVIPYIILRGKEAGLVT